MRLIGVPVGPFTGRAAIALAYAEQPPDDTLAVRQVDSIGQVDVVRFSWGGGGGMMRLTWQEQLVASLDVTFDPE
jgi:hypothetical protein